MIVHFLSRCFVGRSIGYLLLLFSNASFSDQSLLQTITAIQNHPKVLAESANGYVSKAVEAQQRALKLPRITISTDGGQSIFGNVKSGQLRALGDNEFVDLVVTGRQLVYDFGVADNLIESAKVDARADSYLDDIALNQLLGDLANDAVIYDTELQRSSLIESALSVLNEQLALAMLRYESGVVAGDEHRRIKIDLSRLERDLVESKRRIKDLKRRTAEQYALDVGSVHDLYVALSRLRLSTQVQRLSEEVIALRESAARSRLLSAKAERFPKIDLELELRGFDVDQGLRDGFELTGNLQFTVPFFDGGAQQARADAARFEGDMLLQKLLFEKRVHAERSAQIQEEQFGLERARATLELQRHEAQELLNVSLERQGSSAVEITVINRGLMSLYDLDSELLDVNSRISQLDIQNETLKERWPEKLTVLLQEIRS